MRRYELSDEQYELIEPMLPKAGGKGRPWADHRQVMNGLFWKFSSGASWRDIPERYGPWQTIYERYTAWRQDGTWERIVQAVQVKLDATGHINWIQWNIAGDRGYPALSPIVRACSRWRLFVFLRTAASNAPIAGRVR